MTVGLAIGLFVARVLAEATQRPVPPLGIVALAIGSCGVWMWLLRWLGRRGIALDVLLVPALVLLVYVFWPQRDWRVALVVASIVLFCWLMDRSSLITHHASRSTWVDLLTFIVALGVYLATLQKDILPADSGEFQLVVTRLGVLHQPGYPLYTLVGKLFTLLPFGTPALRLNLLSAALAAGTLTLVGATVRRMMGAVGAGQGGAAGLAAVLALGTATTFWAQATTANIRMPTAFFTAWCLYLLVAYRQSLIAPRSTLDTLPSAALTWLALAFSLGLGHYFPLVLIGLFFGLYLVLVDPDLIRQPRRWGRPLLVLALAQLVWLYLPIRAAIAPTPETIGLTSLSGFLWYALGQGFAGDMLAFAGPQHLPSRLALLPTLFQFQMNWVLLAAALMGALWMLWRDWRTGLMLVGAFMVHTFIAITYRAPQTVEYEMPAYVLLAVMIGYGVGQISNLKSQVSSLKSQISSLKSQINNPLSAIGHVLAAGVIVAGLANGLAHTPSFIALANDRSTREYVGPILRDAPPGAVILADWHFATPMWYLQQIEAVRPDVEVRYVFPVAGQEWSQVWRGLIQENISRRPVVVTHYWGLQYPTMPYTFEPFYQAWLVRTAPRFDAPPDLLPLSIEFDGKIQWVGYGLNPTRPSPGQTLEVMLAWRPIVQLDRDYSLTVHLTDAHGARRAQRDRGYPTRTFVPGQVCLDRFTLPLEPTLAPGRYTVQVGVYFILPEGGFRHLATKQGEQMATIATFDLMLSTEPLLTLHPLDVPLVGGPTLVGVDYDRSNPALLRVYLHWRGPGPAGVIGHIGDSAVTLPELPQSATFVTGHDLPPPSSLELRLARPAAGAWGWPVDRVRLPAPRDERYVMLGDQMVLIGVDSPRREVRSGQPVDVTLRYLALKPLVTNDVASVRIEGLDSAWRVASDDHPAGNAFPTLKWIAGSVVDDWRQLEVPTGQFGRVSGHLRVYDEVRQVVLPPLDARMGDDVPLGEWTIK